MKLGDPRNGHRYRTACAAVLALSDLCYLCNHPGAHTIEHIVSVKRWYQRYGTYEGVNDIANLAPAHGQKGKRRNACPVCGRMCNQSKGAGPVTASPRSRLW